MKTNNDFKYDLKVGQQKENELASILSDSTLEVKYDRYSNNLFFIEFYKKLKNGKYKRTGLSKTEANYYALCKSNSFLIIPTSTLKNFLKSIFEEKKKVGFKLKDMVMITGTYAVGIIIDLTELNNYLLKERETNI
ncbi:hypothetical protein MM236_01060 [Belliella sp. DSM 107340]|uniref:Uncharacterized protein n=1 Tax=Belliella calami TaxID=2923436 RepID=A0ABS9UK58_9BACT|nr:hypothetical protein [Belliella calami]MCH7396550.1 hypothetical protein [Belliella calami]